MLTKAITTALAVVIAGCAQTQIAPMGDGEYWVRQESAACAAGVPDAVLMDAHREARALCAAQNAVVKVITEQTEMGIPVIRCTSAEVRFRCHKE